MAAVTLAAVGLAVATAGPALAVTGTIDGSYTIAKNGSEQFPNDFYFGVK